MTWYDMMTDNWYLSLIEALAVRCLAIWRWSTTSCGAGGRTWQWDHGSWGVAYDRLSSSTVLPTALWCVGIGQRWSRPPKWFPHGFQCEMPWNAKWDVWVEFHQVVKALVEDFTHKAWLLCVQQIGMERACRGCLIMGFRKISCWIMLSPLKIAWGTPWLWWCPSIFGQIHSNSLGLFWPIWCSLRLKELVLGI